MRRVLPVKSCLFRDSLTVELQRESDLQLVLPETADFLEADLSGDPAAALAKAEGDHP